jgi:chromosome segregation ATPase
LVASHLRESKIQDLIKAVSLPTADLAEIEVTILEMALTKKS